MINTSCQHRIKTIDITLVALFMVSIVAFVHLYVSSERFFYFWDYSNYANQTGDLALAAKQSLREAWRLFRSSFTDDYNKLFCLPLLPFMVVFGESRLVYVTAYALVYIAPFSLVMGWIAAKIIPANPRAVFWSTTFVTLLLPATWTSALRGYPDIRAAALEALALLIYLYDITLKALWRIVLMALLLAMATPFRRHYAYTTAAFTATVALQGIVALFSELKRSSDQAWRNLMRYVARLALLVGSIICFSPVLLYKLVVFRQDYRALYASYEEPAWTVLRYYGEYFGWLPSGLAILGLIAGSRSGRLMRSGVFVLGMFGVISLMTWTLLAKQTGITFSTHFLFWMALGLSFCFWALWLSWRGNIRLIAVGALGLVLAMNFAAQLAPIGDYTGPLRSLLAVNKAPLVRNDMGEFARLIDFLRKLTPKKQSIFVAAASGVLNQDLIVDAERQLYGIENATLNVVWSPEIDSRNKYPLEGLLQAKFVVVASPFQYSVRPEVQQVVQIGYDAFSEDWNLAQDFAPLPSHFTLDEGLSVRLYQRRRPTSLATTLQTLASIQARIQLRPADQSDWIALNSFASGTIEKNPDQSVNLYAQNTSDSAFLYFAALPDEVKLVGEAQSLELEDGACNAMTLRLSMLNEQGESKEKLWTI